MTRILPVLLLLVACTTQPKVDAARVAAVSRTALTGLETAAAAYMAANPTPPEVRSKVVAAEATAEALVASLPNATPTTAGAAVGQMVASLNAVMVALPPSAVPPSAAAAVAALEIVAAR